MATKDIQFEAEAVTAEVQKNIDAKSVKYRLDYAVTRLLKKIPKLLRARGSSDIRTSITSVSQTD